jgi:hypothetical protein
VKENLDHIARNSAYGVVLRRLAADADKHDTHCCLEVSDLITEESEK